ncbi:rod shape-determining protein MreD [Actibacterium ureilyticum]|uniref:rod shape-determining protein MreD n=1 Tax=Actibacterium ureilyticum TaxID=1590614 RepID=UPI000BAB0771|nr:rod shape-determining protein MreD [Actibacterium ureilyticum]
MVDPATTQRWMHYGLFVAVAGAILFILILPLSTTPQKIPGPDLLVCLAFAWVQRRPDYLPPLLLAAILLVADFLLMRPPGLWAILTLLGAEFLRTRHQGSGEMPFPAEWGFVAVVVILMALINWIVLGITVVPHHDLPSALIRAVMTIIAYPLIVLVTRQVFNIRRAGTGDMES